jgi:CheY-like chemotaxis protein
VLLAEDEPAVRAILRHLLIHCGCTVLEAPDAPAALTIWAAEKSRIHLLITDIVMPGGMTGHELAARLTDERPELKVIYSSGYSASLFPAGQDLIPGRNFLPKPYDASSVVTLIRRVAAERTEMLTS